MKGQELLLKSQLCSYLLLSTVCWHLGGLVHCIFRPELLKGIVSLSCCVCLCWTGNVTWRWQVVAVAMHVMLKCKVNAGSSVQPGAIILAQKLLHLCPVQHQKQTVQRCLHGQFGACRPRSAPCQHLATSFHGAQIQICLSKQDLVFDVCRCVPESKNWSVLMKALGH